MINTETKFQQTVHSILNVPNLRFPGFSEEWEKHRIGELCSFFSGGTPSSSKKEYYGGKISFIRSGEIHSDDTELFLSEEGYKNSSAKMVDVGDILLALYGANSGDIAISKIHGAINQAILCIRTNMVSVFFKSVWEKHTQKILDIYLQGGQGNLSAEIVKIIFIHLPAYDEQLKLAAFISKLEERIAIQNKVIEKLKSLMQGMNDEMMDNPKWEKVQVGDFMEFYSTNSLSWEQLSYTDGHIKNLHYGLIHVGLQTIVDCKNTLLPYIQDSSIPSKYNICKNGDVAFADASEDTAEVGKAIEFDNIGDLNIVCGLHTIHGRDVKNKTICGFKGLAFNSKYFHNQIRRIAQGSKVFSINACNIKTCYLYIPDFAEQQRIVALLRCIQDKIGFEEQVLHFYETQKQYLLQHMFI